MSDVSAHTLIKTRPRAGRDSFVITNAVTVYAGTLIQLSSGFADHWDDAGAGSTFMGMAQSGDSAASTDQSWLGDTSGAPSPDPEVGVDTSGVVLQHLASINGTPAQAKVGDLVYAGTSNTDDMDLQASGNTDPVGWLIRYRSTTDCDVQLFTPTEFLAQQTA